MTSGSVSATASKSIPSVSSNNTGGSASSSSRRSSTHGSMPLPSSSPKVAAAIPTGTTPRASGTSWLAHATVATRSGASSMVVVPSACSITTGNDPDPPDAAVPVDSSESADEPHADSTRAAVVAIRKGTTPRERIRAALSFWRR